MRFCRIAPGPIKIIPGLHLSHIAGLPCTVKTL
jgi:hypothetical protein